MACELRLVPPQLLDEPLGVLAPDERLGGVTERRLELERSSRIT
jgi:hypothetical protein